MKKLFLLASLCTSLFTHAITNNDLEKAIRSLNVRGVEQIVAKEKFTSKELTRYVRLAEEMVRSREIWLLKPDYHNDVTTPSDMPSRFRIGLDTLGLFAGFPMAVISASHIPDCSKSDKNIYIAGTALGLFLMVNFVFEICRRSIADQDQKDRLRKKYENAVTIQQLIYAADTVEA